jgi:hypothetical protein
MIPASFEVDAATGIMGLANLSARATARPAVIPNFPEVSGTSPCSTIRFPIGHGWTWDGLCTV